MIYDQMYQRKFILPIALFYPSAGRDFFNECTEIEIPKDFGTRCWLDKNIICVTVRFETKTRACPILLLHL